MWFFPSPRAFSLSYEFLKIWGGRKFKLGRAMKNAERKKWKPLNLVVSIPRNLLHIHVCPELNLSLCAEEPSVDDPHLTVSLPLSAFVNVVSDLFSNLHPVCPRLP